MVYWFNEGGDEKTTFDFFKEIGKYLHFITLYGLAVLFTIANVSNNPRLWFISNSTEEPFPTWVEYSSPDPTDWIVTILELLCSAPEKFNVTVFAVVAFHSTSENVNGEFASKTETTTALVPKLCANEYVEEVPSPIVSVYFSAVFKAVDGGEGINLVPSNTSASPKAAPDSFYFYRINKESGNISIAIYG